MKIFLDAKNITDFKANKSKLQALILFWILAAGKNGVLSAQQLNKLLSLFPEELPFTSLGKLKEIELSKLMFDLRIGCHNCKASYILNVINSNIDLQTCSPEELEKIKGIGRKTSRCFIIHTRPKARYAGLDTHCLRFLRNNGYPHAPRSTPNTEYLYKKWEQIFLKFVPINISVAEFDLKVWNEGSESAKKILNFC